MASSDKTPTQKHVERATYLIKNSGCPFVEKTEKTPAKAALWQQNYFCSPDRIYLRAFVFPNHSVAQRYGKQFMDNVDSERRKTEGHSRLELNHRYTANGPLLFIIRGDDRDVINRLLSYFAGEE